MARDINEIGRHSTVNSRRFNVPRKIDVFQQGAVARVNLRKDQLVIGAITIRSERVKGRQIQINRVLLRQTTPNL